MGVFIMAMHFLYVVRENKDGKERYLHSEHETKEEAVKVLKVALPSFDYAYVKELGDTVYYQRRPNYDATPIDPSQPRRLLPSPEELLA